MTKTEFKEIAQEVFVELLPKVKSADRADAIDQLLAELQDRGLELEEDFSDEEAEDSDESFDD